MSVLFTRGGDKPEITKSGSYVYHGDPGKFHEWEFRTRLRCKAAESDADKYAETISKVVEGLQGDAFTVAKEVGYQSLWHIGSAGDEFEEATPSGMDALIEAMRASVFPLTTHEAKELFRQYTKPSGALSRQNGESMQQYVSRRRRCWKLLKELDQEIVLSEGHRADMLLDLAGLDRTERTMIQASIGNARDFEKVADALVVQHPRIHLKNTPMLKVKGRGKPGRQKGSGRFKFKGGGKGKGYPFSRSSTSRPSNSWRPQGMMATSYDDYWEESNDAYLNINYDEPYTDPAHYEEDDYWDHDDQEDAAYVADEWAEYPEETPVDEWADFSAYVANEWEKRWTVEDPTEQAELECVACLADVLGPDCFCLLYTSDAADE